MKNKYNMHIFILGILFIIAGIIIFLMPQINEHKFQENIKKQEEEFKEIIEEKKDILDILYEKLEKENEKLYNESQAELKDPFSYEQPSINLEEYGIENNIIGYLNIPKINIEVPIILGANKENMKQGAVHLTQTSYPIGGNNTNSVIAAHRGYSKALLFRNLDKLERGDIIYIKNFKETLRYAVNQIKIIDPTDVKDLLIQEGKDLITLVTCHPYRVNTQRYVVYCERQK